jgi:hypothetical protein
METLEALDRELNAIEGALWTAIHAELDEDFRELIVFATVPDDDPFEPTRLDTIFDTVERIIVSHIPSDIGVRDDRDTWWVSIHADDSFHSLIDGTSGGRGTPGRTNRGSDHVGPPNRDARD